MEQSHLAVPATQIRPAASWPSLSIYDRVGPDRQNPAKTRNSTVVNSAPDIADLPAGYRFGNYVVPGRRGGAGRAGVYRGEQVARLEQRALEVTEQALQDQGAVH